MRSKQSKSEKQTRKNKAYQTDADTYQKEPNTLEKHKNQT